MGFAGAWQTFGVRTLIEYKQTCCVVCTSFETESKAMEFVKSIPRTLRP